MRLENKGTVDVEAGVLNLTAGGSSTAAAEWIGAGEGAVNFSSGYTISGGVISGMVRCNAGTVSVSGTDAPKQT
jgi:hypothetical protein